ncbi:ABC transporter [Terribacillus sp. JSM ZJ617]|uniref:ABC transporter n=1 Tax=Terribacillus sp. JSM ZJ617 TaxID=3342119 RepID=UPI0035A918BA
MEKELLQIFDNWEEKLDQDEWYFRNSYEELLDGLSAESAYNSIPGVVNVLLKMQDSYLLNESIDFLDELYNYADTTEIHSYLKDNLSSIEEHVSRFGDDYSKSSLAKFKSTIRLA